MGDIEDSNTIVCPWHEYRFELKNGTSSTCPLFSVDVLPVFVKCDENNDEFVSVELSDDWELVETQLFTYTKHSCLIKEEERIVPEDSRNGCFENICKGANLVEVAVDILNTLNPAQKVLKTFKASELWLNGDLIVGPTEVKPPSIPPREDNLGFVDPRNAPKRGKGGSAESRIAILHSLANIEQWAIDLAWDMIARFSQTQTLNSLTNEMQPLPTSFLTDFVRMAFEEAKHFSFLVDRLKAHGAQFGDLKVHAGLWDSARDTKDSVLARLAIVHMVHEARGLDVNPNTIEKFRRAGDNDSVEKLTKIHQDEITHVATGQRWFSWICSVSNLDRYVTFHDLVKLHFSGLLKPPFNAEDRLKAGLDPQYYMPLTKVK